MISYPFKMSGANDDRWPAPTATGFWRVFLADGYDKGRTLAVLWPTTTNGRSNMRYKIALIMPAVLAACTGQSAPPRPVAPTPSATPALPSAFDAGWKGERVCEPLFENDQMRSARCTFPPGGGHERHFHRAHWGYIIEGGTMRITNAQGTTERVLKSGTSWWSDGIAWHEAVNIGTTTSVYIIIEPK
jgi:quercetin dioxygenase-like cupin family protein